jgi:hypothetical protein
MQLYSEKITVTHESESENEPARPVSFTWQKKKFHIKEIQKNWQDWGFPAGAPRKKTWRLRRHRTYFRVLTECGRTFQIYMDRKTPQPTWVLYRELETE